MRASERVKALDVGRAPVVGTEKRAELPMLALTRVTQAADGMPGIREEKRVARLIAVLTREMLAVCALLMALAGR